MGADADKFQNLIRNPNVTVLVDNRDVGDVATFQVARVSIQGVAEEIARDGPQGEPFKAIFLKKNPFEAPFFASEKLRMVRVTQAHLICGRRARYVQSGVVSALNECEHRCCASAGLQVLFQRLIDEFGGAANSADSGN